MNLALLGFLMVISFMTLIMTKRLSAVTALIVVPILFGLLAGAGPDLGGMIIKGVAQLAPHRPDAGLRGALFWRHDRRGPVRPAGPARAEDGGG